MQFALVSLLPGMFEALNYGVVGRAIDKHLIQVKCFNPRDYTTDTYHQVDDRPYGGGPGMVMMAEPIAHAIAAAKQHCGPETRVSFLSPQGKRLDHDSVKQLATREAMILVAGRYEGVDERLLADTVDEHWSIGDYVLSGGEFAAMVMIDAITRQRPGVLGHALSAVEDSFATGLLDHPHYTRPQTYREQPVPSVLLNGDHKAIAQWRMQQALGRTWQHRPDLLAQYSLSSEQRHLLDEYIEALPTEE